MEIVQAQALVGSPALSQYFPGVLVSVLALDCPSCACHHNRDIRLSRLIHHGQPHTEGLCNDKAPAQSLAVSLPKHYHRLMEWVAHRYEKLGGPHSQYD